MTELPRHPLTMEDVEALRWEDNSDPAEDGKPGFAHWILYDGAGTVIAEAYTRNDEVKWHCKTSDWRDFAPDMETAKLRAVASYVKELYMAWADANVKARVENAANNGNGEPPPVYDGSMT